MQPAVMRSEKELDEEFAELPHSPADAQAIIRKVHRNVLPPLCAVVLCCYLDRTNLAFASIQLTKDLDFSPEVYGLGAGLFYLGYSICMVPSQLALLRVGTSLWLGGIVCVWGAVATSFCVLTSVPTFLGLRFLLGAAEAGAFPAMWYCLYRFYPLQSITLPFTVLEVAVSVANVIAAPAATVLMGLDGTAGLRGWQVLFLTEGGATIALGALIVLLLRDGPASAEWLSGAERRWLASKVESGSARASAEHQALSDRALLWEAMASPRVWWITGMGLLKNVAAHGMLFWCPIIVSALIRGGAHGGLGPQLSGTSALIAAGTPNTTTTSVTGGLTSSHSSHSHSTAHPRSHPQLWPEEEGEVVGAGGLTPSARTALLLSCVPFFAAALFAVWLGARSQRLGERALHLAAPYFVAGLCFSSLPRAAEASTILAFGVLCVIISCVQGSNAIINSLLPVVAPSPASVPVALALYNSVANLGGLVGPWLIGEVLQRGGGGYGDAMKMMGVIMGIAAAMAWHTRRWQVPGQGAGGRAAGQAPRDGGEEGGSSGGAAPGHRRYDSFTKMLEETEF